MNDIDTFWKVVDFLLGVIVLGLAWWNNTMWNEQKESRKKIHDQQSEIAKLQILVVGNYATRPEVQAQMHQLQTAVERGFDKLEKQIGDVYDELRHKVDKPGS